MRCKIVRTQKLMWHNIMRSTKSKKASILYYSINLKVAANKKTVLQVHNLYP